MNSYITLDDKSVECGVIPECPSPESPGSNFINTPHGRILVPVQTHSCNVAVIGEDGVIPSLDDTDAVISLAPGLKIGVRTADCVPIILFAPDIKAVAAVHAGWRGSANGILDNVIDSLVNLGANTELIKASFGPSICGLCYEVDENLVSLFIGRGFADAIVSYRHISLEKVNTIRLMNKGISPDYITHSHFCTKETPVLPSWRRNPGPERLLTWIVCSL